MTREEEQEFLLEVYEEYLNQMSDSEIHKEYQDIIGEYDEEED